MKPPQSKNDYVFVVSDVGGVPLLSIPEISPNELNVLTMMASVIDSIASVIYEKGFSIGTIDTTNRKLLYIKRKNLVFLLLVPKNINISLATATLRELAEKFISTFGEDPDAIQGILLFNNEALDSFQKEVINAIMDIIREASPEHLDVFLEELFKLLKERGADISRLSTKFIPVNVPVSNSNPEDAKIKDDITSQLLKLCDGRRTVQEIASQLGIPTAQAYAMLAKLQKKGLISWKVIYRLKR